MPAKIVTDPKSQYLLITAETKSWNVTDGDDYLHEFNQDQKGEDADMDYFKIHLK